MQIYVYVDNIVILFIIIHIIYSLCAIHLIIII